MRMFLLVEPWHRMWWERLRGELPQPYQVVGGSEWRFPTRRVSVYVRALRLPERMRFPMSTRIEVPTQLLSSFKATVRLFA